MNDDVWTMLLELLRSWGLELGAADPRLSEAAAATQVVRRLLLVRGSGAEPGPSAGARYYADKPSSDREARGWGRRSGRGPRVIGTPLGADHNSGKSLRGRAIKPRKARCFGSLLQRFRTLRNRRMSPRLCGAQDRPSVQKVPSSRSCVRGGCKWGFAEFWRDGEPSSAEPP